MRRDLCLCVRGGGGMISQTKTKHFTAAVGAKNKSLTLVTYLACDSLDDFSKILGTLPQAFHARGKMTRKESDACRRKQRKHDGTPALVAHDMAGPVASCEPSTLLMQLAMWLRASTTR